MQQPYLHPGKSKVLKTFSTKQHYKNVKVYADRFFTPVFLALNSQITHQINV